MGTDADKPKEGKKSDDKTIGLRVMRKASMDKSNSDNEDN